MGIECFRHRGFRQTVASKDDLDQKQETSRNALTKQAPLPLIMMCSSVFDVGMSKKDVVPTQDTLRISLTFLCRSSNAKEARMCIHGFTGVKP